jgi:hypothetical protein
MIKGRLIGIGIIDLLVIAVGLILDAIFHNMLFVSIAVALVAIVTFFGVLTGDDQPPDEPLLRRAITIAVVTVYLVLVAIVAFFKGTWQSPEVTQTLLASFTSIAGVIVAFYFGATAYLEVKSKSDPNAPSKQQGGTVE